MNQPLALVIDDEPDICELLTLTLGRMDIRTETAMDVSGAKTLLGKHDFDICLTDMRLPDGDGLDLVAWMQTNASGVPVAVADAIDASAGAGTTDLLANDSDPDGPNSEMTIQSRGRESLARTPVVAVTSSPRAKR